jgi:hypothetical protein
MNLVPREGTIGGSGIIRFREEPDWPLKRMNLSHDSWLPAMDYPRASRSFPRIAGLGNEIAIYIATYLALINHLKRCGGLLSTQI